MYMYLQMVHEHEHVSRVLQYVYKYFRCQMSNVVCMCMYLSIHVYLGDK